MDVEEIIEIISVYFNRLNADTINTFIFFQVNASRLNIEFRLAKIDSDANCTDGIVRVESDLTYQARDEVKATSYWPSDRYFNVWTVASIESSSGGGGTVLGYAQFPGIGAWNTYGVVCRADALTDRTMTHEAGHCFGLFHTFQSGCGSSCENSGDNVCDTPPSSDNTFGCNTTQNLCPNDATGMGDTNNINPYTTDIVDQIENYMSYDACQNMFTKGQANRMRATIESFSQLVNLTSISNLTATGVDSGYSCSTIPVADFSIPDEYLCTKSSSNVQNNSYNGSNLTYVWNFIDAAEVSDVNAKEPLVRWGETGVYDVTLEASNSAGTGTLTKVGEAKVLNGTPIEPFSESFASLGFPRNDPNDPTKTWFIDGLTNDETWKKTTNASSDEGGTSLMLDIKITNGVHRLISPMIDLTQSNCDKLTFDMAYASRASGSTEKLIVKTSTNCGRAWRTSGVLYEVEGDSIAPNSPLISGDYIPSESQWKTHEVDISGVKNESEILFMFEFETKTGNTIYLDNINFGCNERLLSPIEERTSFNFNIFPNPSKGDANITINSFDNSNVKISITDITGKIIGVKEIANTNNYNTTVSSIVNQKLNSGVYFVSVVNNNNIKTQKIIVE